MPSRAQRIENAQQAGKIPSPSRPANAAPTTQASTVPQLQTPAQQVSAPQTYQTPTGSERKPANPPQITYSGGRLAIIANNSSLADILNGIQTTTGSKLEGTQPDSERVFGQFGPGSPRQVLDALLAGSRFDFILLGSIEDPGNVERIVLSPHSSASASTQQASRPNVQNQQADDDDNDNYVPPQPVPQPPPGAENAQPNPNQQPGNPQVRTPEQLLQELQRMRQQQQQQQQAPQPR